MLVFYTRHALSDLSRQVAACAVDFQFFDQGVGREEWDKCFAKLGPGDRLYLLMASDLGDSFKEAGRVLQSLLALGVEVVVLQTGKVFKSSDFAVDALASDCLEAMQDGWQTYARLQKKSSGKPMGRPRLATPPNFPSVQKAYGKKEISLLDAAEACGMSQTTFWRRSQELQ